MKQIFLMLAAGAALTFTACNNDDGGNPTPAPATGEISATQTLNLLSTDNDWSLPIVTGRMSAFNITFTAHNSNTGEILILNLPNNGVGLYYGQSSDFTSGVANYFPGTGEDVQVSSSTQSDAYIFVTITAIDSVNKTMNATFGAWVFAADTANSPSTIFSDGTLVDVPYTGSSTALNFNNGSTLTATTDGVAFSPANLLVTDLYESISIIATGSDGRAITIGFPYTLPSGTYSLVLGAEEDLAITANYSNGTNAALAVNGSMSITRNFVDQTIEGTFSFDAGDVQGNFFEITNGSFDVTY